jgi:hypothetical protein
VSEVEKFCLFYSIVGREKGRGMFDCRLVGWAGGGGVAHNHMFNCSLNQESPCLYE